MTSSAPFTSAFPKNCNKHRYNKLKIVIPNDLILQNRPPVFDFIARKHPQKVPADRNLILLGLQHDGREGWTNQPMRIFRSPPETQFVWEEKSRKQKGDEYHISLLVFFRSGVDMRYKRGLNKITLITRLYSGRKEYREASSVFSLFNEKTAKRQLEFPEGQEGPEDEELSNPIVDSWVLREQKARLKMRRKESGKDSTSLFPLSVPPPTISSPMMKSVPRSVPSLAPQLILESIFPQYTYDMENKQLISLIIFHKNISDLSSLLLTIGGKSLPLTKGKDDKNYFCEMLNWSEITDLDYSLTDLLKVKLRLIHDSLIYDSDVTFTYITERDYARKKLEHTEEYNFTEEVFGD